MTASILSIATAVTIDASQTHLTFTATNQEDWINFDRSECNWDNNVTDASAVQIDDYSTTITVTLDANTLGSKMVNDFQLALFHSELGSYEYIDFVITQSEYYSDVTSDIGWSVTLTDKSNHTFYASFTYDTEYNPSIVSYTSKIKSAEITGGDDGSCQVRIVSNGGNDETTSVDSITFEFTIGTYSFTKVMYVYAMPQTDYNRPIWKDSDIEYYTEKEYIPYLVKLEDKTVIYTGRAYNIEDNGLIKIRISDICKDYLCSVYNNSPTPVKDADFRHTFYVYMTDDDYENEEYLAKYDFYDSWSYEDNQHIDSIIGPIPLNNAILTSLPQGAYAPISVYCANGDSTKSQLQFDVVTSSALTAYSMFYDGSNTFENIDEMYEWVGEVFDISSEEAEARMTSSTKLLISGLTEYEATQYADKLVQGKEGTGESIGYDVKEEPTYSRYYLSAASKYDLWVPYTGQTFTQGGNVKYTYDNCKASYALYYLNSQGGWDAIALYGKETKTDDISSNYITKYNNNTKVEYGKQRYLAEITENWSLNTGYLTDIQSLRMKEIIESNQVYLHILETNEIVAVYMTNEQMTYKTFANQRTVKVYHILNFENARKKYRR